MIIVLVVLIVVLILCVLKIYVFDDKVKNENSITKKTGLNSIGQLPFNDNNGNIMIENKSKANMMKYIKDIRSNILKRQDKKVVSILSCNRGEGKSYIANNLAISISRLNKTVLLIDGNVREKSDICDTFYIEKGEGFTDFIKNIEIGNKYKNLKNAKEYIKQSQIPNLYVLQNGTITEHSNELLKTRNAKEVMDLLKEIYDIIIIDGTSLLENEDALVLSKLSDTNILVVENHKTTYKDIILSKNQLEYNNDEIYGFILNKINVIKGKYYSKTDNQNYGMYIETREEHYKTTNTDEIVDPITAKINKKEPEKFEILRKELKENIMDEDFINDIEVNFNMKIDSMEKENERNINYLLDNIQSLKHKIDEEKANSEFRRGKDAKGFDKFSKMIADKFEKMEEQISLVKKKNETEGEFFERRIIEQSQRHDKQIELLNNQIIEKEQSYNKKLDELNNQILDKDKNYNERISKLNTEFEDKEKLNNDRIVELKNELKDKEKQYENKNDELNRIIVEKEQLYNETIEELRLQIENKDKKYINEIDTLFTQISEKDKFYNEKIAELNIEFGEKAKIYEEKINELNNRIDDKDNMYKIQIDTLNAKIEDNKHLYNGSIEELKKELEIKDKEYKEKILELNEQIIDLTEKQEIEQEIPSFKDENKIINLGKFFNNKRKNNRVFSIHEPISYYDLERLATEVILLNDEETNYSNNVAK